MSTQQPSDPIRPASASDAKPASMTVAIPAWLSDYLKANPVGVAWQAMLAFGGLLLAVHFIYIRFFPDLDWQSSLALIAMIALTGLVFWCLVSLMFVFPSFIWAEILGMGGAAVRRRGGPKWWGTLLLFGTPVAAFWAAAALVIRFKASRIYSSPVLMTLALFGPALLTCVVAFCINRRYKLMGRDFRRIRLYRYAAAALSGCLVFGIPASIVYALAHSRYNPSPGKPFVFIAGVFIAFIYNAAALHLRLSGKSRKSTHGSFAEALLVGAALCAGMIAATNNWVLIPEGIASLYGIGNVSGATLILDNDGCEIARALNVPTNPAQGPGLCSVTGVTILNRLGTTYYFEWSDTKFTLPASAVKSTSSETGAAAQDSSARTLRVALYPFIPAKADFFLQVKQDFEARYPNVRLDIVDLTDNYYDSKSPDFIGTTKADVYELDSIFLSDFVAGNRIQELPEEMQPSPGDFLANAVKGAQLDGKWYGVPHWVCGDFLFYLKDDPPLRSARTLAGLEKAIGRAHPPGRGLFIDMKGSSTLGELYLKSAFDRYADWAHVAPHVQVFDDGLQSDLGRARALCDAGFCRQRSYHDAGGFYGRLFARRKARAAVGYSELLYYVLLESGASCALEDKCVTEDELDVSPLPLDDRGAQPMSWVDSLTIDKDCGGVCRQDAALFIKFYTSEESLLKALSGTPARYLLPARASLYQNTALLQHAPLYQKLKPIIEQAVAPTATGLSDKLRALGEKVDSNLPQ